MQKNPTLLTLSLRTMFSPSKAREWWPAWCPGLTEEEDPPSIKQTAEAANRTPPPAPAYPILGAKGHAAGEQAKTNRAAYRSISCIQSYTLFRPFLLSPRSPLILLVAGLYITFAVAEIIPSSSSPTSGLRPAPFHCRHRRAPPAPCVVRSILRILGELSLVPEKLRIVS